MNIQQINNALLSVVKTVNAYLSDYILIILLIGVGIYFTFRTGFVQVRCFGEGMKRVFGKISLRGNKQESGMSSFQALATAVAAQVGTGNIVGACGAILTGGPGAVFWMWIIAFFGMATIYAEAVLAQRTKKVLPDGTVTGGPVYYIKEAFKGKFGTFLSGFFAIAIILAIGFMGSMVQSNSISEACNAAFGIPTWVVGAIIVFVSAFIFIGGIQRIAAVTEKVVPVMAVLYLAGAFVLLICRIEYIPATIAMIFKFAFSPQSIIGGGVGYAIKTAISQGVKRGLFSNEAGMGSTPHAHALANVEKPHDQGIVAIIGVFIDTFCVLTATALIVISTLYTGPCPMISIEGTAEGLTKSNMVQTAFANVFGGTIGNAFVAICLLFFAYSTIISWNYFGKINVQYLFGKKATKIYTVFALVFIFLGSALSNDLVWEMADMFNQLMVLPNAIALFALGGVVAKEAKNSTNNKLKK